MFATDHSIEFSFVSIVGKGGQYQAYLCRKFLSDSRMELTSGLQLYSGPFDRAFLSYNNFLHEWR